MIWFSHMNDALYEQYWLNIIALTIRAECFSEERKRSATSTTQTTISSLPVINVRTTISSKKRININFCKCKFLVAYAKKIFADCRFYTATYAKLMPNSIWSIRYPLTYKRNSVQLIDAQSTLLHELPFDQSIADEFYFVMHFSWMLKCWI